MKVSNAALGRLVFLYVHFNQLHPIAPCKLPIYLVNNSLGNNPQGCNHKKGDDPYNWEVRSFQKKKKKRRNKSVKKQKGTHLSPDQKQASWKALH